MLVDIGLLVLGGVLLYFGAEWLVGGAAGLARLAGVRPMIVGLTVVSWGTSAPELVVSALASLKGTPDIALGNVIGSNIANLGLILGITALVSPPKIEGGLILREVPLLLLCTLAIPLLLLNGVVSRIEGVVLLAGAVAFSVWLIKRGAPPGPAGNGEVEDEDLTAPAPHPGSMPKMIGLTVLGLLVLVGGGRFFVEGATGIATALGISERVVGLTVVAIGTSLPELATSMIAAFRGHSDIAVGNVVGSNIFNVLIVLGAASAIHPLAADINNMRLDLAVMLVMTVICAVMMRSARALTRIEGGLLLGGYVAFLGALVVGG
jgi:cation:H+ antiporter